MASGRKAAAMELHYMTFYLRTTLTKASAKVSVVPLPPMSGVTS